MKIIPCLLICLLSFTAYAEAIKTPPSISDSTPVIAPTPENSDDLVIREAYVRPLIPGQKNTAAYMRISNFSKEKYVLVGVSSPIAERAEIHNVTMNDGMMQMRAVESILLLSKEEVLLQPGDLHIMLINVQTEALNKDTQVPLCLKFQNSADICLSLPVQDKRGEKTNADVHVH
ncbi:MAG TPA: copper chaperone PCu(A)C [Gammaproteobacteria bacterium]|nr:copper chaperone PCu(A)C [Gammaproteobacteria bacterium]